MNEKTLGFLVLAVMVLSFEITVPRAYAEVGSQSGNETLFVGPASKESITKFLDVGERITGRISVSDGDNYINFKLFDPAGNLCLWTNVLQSVDFSWGPAKENGEYKLEFDNWFDVSNGNTVNLEFQITSPLDDSFPITLVLIIAAVLIAITIPSAIVLRGRDRSTKKTRSTREAA